MDDAHKILVIGEVNPRGEGAFGGDSVFAEETLAHTGSGGTPGDAAKSEDAEAAAAEAAALSEVEEVLTGKSGESMVSDIARRHIVTEVTDEGLVISIFDTETDALFEADSARPTELTAELVDMLTQVFGLVKNGIAVEGHVAARPVVLAENESWELSAERADALRRLLEDKGVAPERMRRVTGHADRRPAVANPMAVRNNQIELILLRSKR